MEKLSRKRCPRPPGDASFRLSSLGNTPIRKNSLLCNLEWERMEEREKPKKQQKLIKHQGMGVEKPKQTKNLTGL